jgi:hypothetical protein
MSISVQKKLDNIYKCIMGNDTPINGNKLQTIKDELKQFESVGRPGSNTSTVSTDSMVIINPSSVVSSFGVPPPPPPPPPQGFALKPLQTEQDSTQKPSPNLSEVLKQLGNFQFKSSNTHAGILNKVNEKLDATNIAAAAVAARTKMNKESKVISGVEIQEYIESLLPGDRTTFRQLSKDKQIEEILKKKTESVV